MTPTVSPSTLETVSFAAWSSIRTLSRTRVTIRLFPPFAGSISRRTFVPFLPLILSTISSKRQPIISSISPFSWPTPMILSPACNFLLRSAGAPGTKDLMLVSSSSDCNVAPIPSKERFMLSLKLFAVRGAR